MSNLLGFLSGKNRPNGHPNGQGQQATNHYTWDGDVHSLFKTDIRVECNPPQETRLAYGNETLMKILITGAGGNLGRAIIPALIEAGHSLRLFDFRDIAETGTETIVGDVRDIDDVRAAMSGMDAIVHAAALHGIHLAKWRPEDFWGINVTGTFNVYEAAREAGIKRVVLCSTMGVYGDSARAPDDAWSVVDESNALLPGDVYGMSKKLCEEMAAVYARKWGITTVALRLGMFVPESNLDKYGFRLLFGGVDDRDVVQAVSLALTHESEGGFDAFDIMAPPAFEPSDPQALHTDPLAVLEQRYPGCNALFVEKGIDARPLIWGRTLWPVTKAMDVLRYKPQFGFDGYLNSLRSGATENYYPPQGLSWWGV
jgi:nucleoside-diphosphate-sugar epimerase